MRLLIVLLVAANVLLYGWFQGWMRPYGGDGREPARMDRQQDAERLRIVPTAPPAAQGAATGAGDAAAGQPSGTTERGAPDGAPAQTAPDGTATLSAAACLEVGPMTEADAVRLQVALDAGLTGLKVRLLSATPAQAFWVVLPPAGGDLRKRIEALRARGVPGEGLVAIREGPWKGGVALGKFRTEADAAALLRDLQDKGVDAARLAPRPPAPARLTLQLEPSSEALVLELSRQVDALPGAGAPRPCARPG
jgi:hypothetical protein